jgi:hypothetical protein
MTFKYIVAVIAALVQIVLNQRNRGREHSSNDYLNVQVNRTINLSKSVIKVESRILTKSMKVDPIYSYRFPLLKNASRHLVNIAAKLQSAMAEEETIKLKISKQNSNDENFDFFEISFKSEPMNHEEERLLIITEEYFEKLQLLPKKISMKDDQLVVFKDTLNHLSYYQTNAQKVVVQLPYERTQIM